MVVSLRDLKRDFDIACRRIDERSSLRYVEVSESGVDSKAVEAAKAMASICALDLGIEAPRVRWFTGEMAAYKAYRQQYGDSDFGTELPEAFKVRQKIVGKAERVSNEIWIKVGLCPWETIDTVAHEVAHCSQSDRGLLRDFVSFDHQHRKNESGASKYATRKMAELKGRVA